MLTERHLDGLINDASSTLELLTTLSNSFKSVEAQTSSFQAQCEGLVSEQQRLEKLANEVGTDLYYYTYLDTVTRRLNAPGAGRLIEDDGFGDMVENIDACIVFMTGHVRCSTLPLPRCRPEANKSRRIIETETHIWRGTMHC